MTGAKPARFSCWGSSGRSVASGYRRLDQQFHVPLQGHLLEQMYTSLYSMEQPLWQAYDPSPELVKIAEGMYHQNFTSAAERRETFAEGLELALKHSYRIWLIWEE